MAGEELNVKKMKVSELRDALRERGLSTDGLKGDLVNRLEGYLEEQEFAMPISEATDLVPSPSTPVGEPKKTTTATAAVDQVAPAPNLAADDVPKEEAAAQRTKKTAQPPAAAVETKKEEPTAPGLEPAPAPVVPDPTPANATTDTTSSTSKDAAKSMEQMTHSEKKAARAARFGIPLVVPGQQGANKKRQQPQPSSRNSKKDKQQQQKEQTNKRQKTLPKHKQQASRQEKPLLSVEEIEKRLKRAEKFGTGDDETMKELKAMLRKHRFAKSPE